MGSVIVAIAMSIAIAGCSTSSNPRGDAAPDGAALYGQACASCHGADLRGTDRGPSHLSIVYEPGHHPDAAFRSAVRKGVAAHHWSFGPMLPVPGLDDDEVEAIIRYIREVQQREGFEPYPP